MARKKKQINKLKPTIWLMDVALHCMYYVWIVWPPTSPAVSKKTHEGMPTFSTGIHLIIFLIIPDRTSASGTFITGMNECLDFYLHFLTTTPNFPGTDTYLTQRWKKKIPRKWKSHLCIGYVMVEKCEHEQYLITW